MSCKSSRSRAAATGAPEGSFIVNGTIGQTVAGTQSMGGIFGLLLAFGTYSPVTAPAAYTSTQFGTTGDVPVPGDYDGDGKADIAVWRPSNGIWFEQRSTSGFFATQFGQNGDKPVPSGYVPVQ